MLKRVHWNRVGIVLIPLLLYASAMQAQPTTHRFELSGHQFLLDGKPFRIISGEMHPARIPRAYWQHRIQLAKAMGCNTIAAYVFWNYLETKEAQFDFKSDSRDIAAFIRLCQQEGMWVLLRPGPYVCAEWDFGGLPSYLLKIPDIKLRCMDPRYLTAVKRYIDALAAEVKPLLASAGGPILMLQVENEYGSYGNDRTYMKTVQDYWIENGITGPFYTSDGPTAYMLEAGSLPGAAIGLDSGDSPAAYEKASDQDSTVPAFSSETYPGWLTHWFEKWQRPDTNSLKREIDYLLKSNHSFNLYVVHGGTNFGYTAGANAFSPTQYQPDVTSYDYDAPIDEQGRPTAKYYMLRHLIQSYQQKKLPPVPDPVPTMEIPAISLKPSGSIWQQLPEAIHRPQPVPMESLDQNQGLMLYRTHLVGHKSGTLKIWEPHDFALVFLDGVFIDTVYRDAGNWSVKIPESNNPNPQLDILVEGMGHINFAQFMIDRKGITDRVTLNGMTLMDWEQFPIPLDSAWLANRTTSAELNQDPRNGIIFTGEFNLDKTADTFFDLTAFKKGTLFVNGHNLGRYWYVGPQQRLYCPATWLKKGKNAITVIDFFQQEPASIRGQKTMNP